MSIPVSSRSMETSSKEVDAMGTEQHYPAPLCAGSWAQILARL